MRTKLAAGLAALIAFSGCGSVKVVRLGPTAEAKPLDCQIDFLESPPSRPFTELAELTRHVTSVPLAGPAPERGKSMEAADEALHEEACRQGADAVVVTLVTVINVHGHLMVSGKAIKYAPQPEPPPATPEAPGAAPSSTPTPTIY